MTKWEIKGGGVKPGMIGGFKLPLPAEYLKLKMKKLVILIFDGLNPDEWIVLTIFSFIG